MRGVYVLLLISLLGYTGRVSGQESVTITQCYEWARANYPQIHQMGLIDQTERYSLSNVGKAWLPQLSVSGKASYQSDVTKLPLDGDKISSLLPGFEIPSLSKDQYQVVAQVDQTIWDGGSTRSARALTRAEAIANREQLESELYALNDRVNQIYFGLPAARRVDTSERFAPKGVAGQYRAYRGDDGEWRGESIGSGKYGSGTAECPPK